jgi:hypothetical protein
MVAPQIGSVTPGTGMRDLGTLGGVYAIALGLSDAGIATGWSETAAGEHQAAAWLP